MVDRVVGRLSFDPCTPAGGNVEKFFESDLACIATPAHEEPAVGHAQVDTGLRALVGEKPVGETAGESIAASLKFGPS